MRSIESGGNSSLRSLIVEMTENLIDPVVEMSLIVERSPIVERSLIMSIRTGSIHFNTPLYAL